MVQIVKKVRKESIRAGLRGGGTFVSDVKNIPAAFPVAFPETRMRRADKVENEICLFLKHQHSGFWGQLAHE